MSVGALRTSSRDKYENDRDVTGYVRPNTERLTT
jgi:hypothetical protein